MTALFANAPKPDNVQHMTGNQEIDVTPELAERWLGKMPVNRRLRHRVVSILAEDMRSGDWRWTGETVKFDIKGNLIDGQHRLRAVVESGMTIRFLVVYGLETEAQQDIDTGLPRRFADVLTLRGEINTSILSAVIRKVDLWDRGYRRGIGSGSGGGGSKNTSSTAMLLRVLNSHPELREIVGMTATLKKRIDLPPGLLALALWLFSNIDDEDARVFFDRLADGVELTEDSPIYRLRLVLADLRDGRKTRTSETFLLALTIKAWNAYREGRPMMQLRYRIGGAQPEPFPEPA